MEGDTVILQKKDREVSDTANWNVLLGQRLEVLELMDTCEDDFCFHTMKVKTTKGEILDVDVDENHDDMMDSASVFREVYFR